MVDLIALAEVAMAGGAVGLGLGRGPVAEEIARVLSEGIEDGLYPAGCKLPTEHELSRRFGVSRTVVREAISRMKSDGLVTSRQGSGLWVASPAIRNSFKISGGSDDTLDVLALLELRQPVEMSAARLAAARRSDTDLAEIVRAHVAMSESGDWSEEGVIGDLEFHHAIAKATGNKYYADFMAFLAGALQNNIRRARAGSGETEIKRITLQEHHRILRAIEERDPESAGLAMMAHLQGARERTKLSSKR